MAVLLDAAARGHLAYEDIPRVYSLNPARTYGLWPRKGRLAPGADADIILVDPTAKRTLHNADVLSKAGWTPFDGQTLTGRVVQTYLRGRLAADESKPADDRSGRFIAGVGYRGN